MKVLQVLGGGAWGGGSVVVLHIVKAMIERGDEVYVVALDDETAHHFRAAGAHPVKAPLWLRPISPLDLVPMLWLWWFCLTKRIDFVATHTSKGGFLGRIAARMAGVPRIVHHIHGFGFHQFTHPLVKRVYVALEALSARCADLMITVGEQHREIAIAEGICPPHKVVTVLNGIDLEKFSRAVPAQLPVARPGHVLGSIGRLAEQKGFEYMIRALPAIVERHKSATLVLAGTGPLEGQLRAVAAECGVTEHVCFLGFRRDIPELLAAFDIFVHPSLWEGLSISLMEAMAAGKPIVASRIPGNVEMIDDGRNGLFAEPTDVTGLATAVNRMFDDPGYAGRCAALAQVDARRRFGWERMVDENIAAYDSTAGQATRLSVAR
jgi:glycosyltransferase involved in cell wall biosynthesis